jgi:ankyrin repeat protein
MKSKAEIDVPNYLEVCLSKCHVEMIQTLIQKHQAEPTFEQLMKYCFPPKVDDPEADKYVEMAKIILKVSPNFIHQTDENHETALHRAVISGNLPCVVFFAEAGGDLEACNILGNTPLWLACAKRYPCIIDDLLQRGADPNAKNEKGDTPMYSICQYGPLKVVDTLLSFGADVRNINRNGDTLILIACRNGQDEILKTMLSYVSMDFINRKAQIDGFNAIMASAEAGHGKCIRVLHAHGINIEQRTDKDNEILKCATPLQIAIYYSKVEAVYSLLDLGADPNIKDIFGMTALHHAVMKGNIPIIQWVVKYGGDFTIEDNQGNRPLFYCRNDSIKHALLPRSLEPLMKLARGDYSRKNEDKEEEEMLTILRESDLNVDGCFTSAEIVDVRDSYGNTPPIGLSDSLQIQSV